MHGQVEITADKAARMKDNFDGDVFGQTLTWNYAHFEDQSKGQRAAGVIEKVSLADDGLYAGVRLTPTAQKELADGEWLYTSPEYKDYRTDPRTGDVIEDVLVGGALTNYPFLKGISPINMSELVLEVADKETLRTRHRDRWRTCATMGRRSYRTASTVIQSQRAGLCYSASGNTTRRSCRSG